MIPQNHQQFLSPAAPATGPFARKAIPMAIRDDDSARLELRIGIVAAVGFFGLFLGWAAFAPLDAATHATGTVTVSGNRQVVQHRDGGTVSALLVHEGQHVTRGQILVELAPAEVRASERGLTAQVLDLQAQIARLDAEQTGSLAIATPTAFAALPAEDRPLADTAMARQRTELLAQRHASAVQKAVLAKQASELDSRIGGIGQQIAAGRRQSVLFDKELGGMRQLLAQGFASANRVNALERSQEALVSENAGLTANVAATRQQIGETRLQAAALDAGLLREVAEARRTVQANLNDLLPRLGAARAQLDRTRIRATASGQVLSLDVSTVGAVVQPGQTLMEIVPDDARLVVTARVSPGDADDLHVGQDAELKLTALHDRALPAVTGTITRLAADSVEDRRTGIPFYTAEITVPEKELKEVARLHGSDQVLRPGMPAEMLVRQRARTMLQYLFEPLDRAMWSSLRER